MNQCYSAKVYSYSKDDDGNAIIISEYRLGSVMFSDDTWEGSTKEVIGISVQQGSSLQVEFRDIPEGTKSFERYFNVPFSVEWHERRS